MCDHPVKAAPVRHDCKMQGHEKAFLGATSGAGDATIRLLNFVLQPGRFLSLLASYLICE